MGPSMYTARLPVQTRGSWRPGPQKVAPMVKSTSPRLSVLQGSPCKYVLHACGDGGVGRRLQAEQEVACMEEEPRR